MVSAAITKAEDAIIMIRSFLIFCFLLLRLMNTSRPPTRTFSILYFHFENCFAYSMDILTLTKANYTEVVFKKTAQYSDA